MGYEKYPYIITSCRWYCKKKADDGGGANDLDRRPVGFLKVFRLCKADSRDERLTVRGDNMDGDPEVGWYMTFQEGRKEAEFCSCSTQHVTVRNLVCKVQNSKL